MHLVKFPLLAVAGLLLAAAPAGAAVLTDPTLHNGPTPKHAIDPSNRIKLWPSGARPTRVQLYETPGFGVIQDFTGFTNGTNVITFTDPARADVQISFGASSQMGSAGGKGASGSELTNSGWVTSGESGVRWTSNGGNAAAHNLQATIAFGTYDGRGFSTDGAPAVQTASFTITSHRGRYDGIGSVAVTYFSPAGKELHTQTISKFDVQSNVFALFFSYAAPQGESIGKIAVTVKVKEAAARKDAQIILGIDDLGYTAVVSGN